MVPLHASAALLAPLFAFAAIGLPAHAARAQEAGEPSLVTPIARAPGLVLMDLLPTTVLDAGLEEWAMRPGGVRNETGGVFEVTFEIEMPQYPGAYMTLLAGDREFLVGMARRMFESEALRNELSLEDDFPEPFDCLGAPPAQFTCRIGSGVVQFTASGLGDDLPLPYADAKAILLTLPLDNYRAIFGDS